MPEESECFLFLGTTVERARAASRVFCAVENSSMAELLSRRLMHHCSEAISWEMARSFSADQQVRIRAEIARLLSDSRELPPYDHWIRSGDQELVRIVLAQNALYYQGAIVNAPVSDDFPGQVSEDREIVSAAELEAIELPRLMADLQSYYAVLEFAVRQTRGSIDMRLNLQYNQLVRRIASRLADTPRLREQSIDFTPPLQSLLPSAAREYQWHEDVEPHLDTLVTKVTQYAECVEEPKHLKMLKNYRFIEAARRESQDFIQHLRSLGYRPDDADHSAARPQVERDPYFIQWNDTAPNAPLVLAGAKGFPWYINGDKKDPLTDDQQRVVEALARAGKHGLFSAELKGMYASAVRMLRDIRSIDDDWSSVILMAKQRGKRYRFFARNAAKTGNLPDQQDD